jgi:hypothetical protein
MQNVDPVLVFDGIDDSIEFPDSPGQGGASVS